MRTVIITCIDKEKSCTSLCWSNKVFEENSETTWGYRAPIKNVQKGLSLDQNWMLVDVADVINELSLIKFIFALKYICFSFALLSLLLYSYFHCFACLSKEITTTKKKTSETKFENNILKIRYKQVTFICIKKHEVNEIWQKKVVEIVEFVWYN